MRKRRSRITTKWFQWYPYIEIDPLDTFWSSSGLYSIFGYHWLRPNLPSTSVQILPAYIPLDSYLRNF